jgi:hypothetical protein
MRSNVLYSLLAVLAFVSAAACNRCDRDPGASSSVSIAWSITDLAGVSTCVRAGAASVSLTLHNRRSGDDARFTFPCTDSQVTLSPVAAGPYDATLSLLAADGATLAVGPTQDDIRIGVGGTVALAPVEFVIEGGRLVLSVETLATRANCASREQGGAGTGANTITMQFAGGGCAAARFTRMRGTTKLGEYQVNCSSPQIATCIERDEVLVANGLRSGPYVIRVDSLIGPARCSNETDILTVPAGATIVKTIQLPPNAGTSC